MADPNALGDLLSGAAGKPVDRLGLNNFVASSQARNGLVSAQTQDAMIKAMQAQEDMEAHDRLATEFIGAGMKPSDAYLARDLASHALGGPETAMKVISQIKLGYGSPADQTSGQQMNQGHIAGPVQTPGNFQMPVGSPLAGQPVQQNPEAEAQTANYNAMAGLHQNQADNPAAFHAGGQAGPLDPNAVAFGSYMLYKTGKMPTLGMGGGAARMAILSGAAQLGQQEASGQNVTNPAFDNAIANGQDFSTTQRGLNAFAVGPPSNQARSINNVVGHLQLMENLFTGLQNGDVQIANKIGAQWKKAFGSEVPTDIQTAASFIGPELTKILSANNSTGTAPERQEFSNTAANLANAPEQTGGAIATLKNMLGRQMTDLAIQYHGATGRSDFARRYVAPDVARYLDIEPEGASSALTPTGGGPSATGAAPPASTAATSVSPAGGAATTLPPQALTALQAHPGQHVTFGNGQVWTLQNGKPVRVQ